MSSGGVIDVREMARQLEMAAERDRLDSALLQGAERLRGFREAAASATLSADGMVRAMADIREFSESWGMAIRREMLRPDNYLATKESVEIPAPPRPVVFGSAGRPLRSLG